MCRAVTCRKCGKTTWAGCGQHVDSVMRGVRVEDRCRGHEDEPSTGFLAKALRPLTPRGTATSCLGRLRPARPDRPRHTRPRATVGPAAP